MGLQMPTAQLELRARVFLGQSVEPGILLHRGAALSRVVEVDGPTRRAGLGHHGDAVGRHDHAIRESQEGEERVVRVVLPPAIEEAGRPDPLEERARGLLQRPRARRHEQGAAELPGERVRLLGQARARGAIEGVGAGVAASQHGDPWPGKMRDPLAPGVGGAL